MPNLRIKVSAEHLAYSPRRKYIEYELFTRALGRKGLGGHRVILIAGDEALIPRKKLSTDPDLAFELRERWENGEDIDPFEFDIEWGKK